MKRIHWIISAFTLACLYIFFWGVHADWWEDGSGKADYCVCLTDGFCAISLQKPPLMPVEYYFLAVREMRDKTSDPAKVFCWNYPSFDSEKTVVLYEKDFIDDVEFLPPKVIK